MQRNGAIVDYNPFSLGVLGIKDQQNAFLAAKNQLSARHREYLLQAKDLAVKAFRRFKVVHIESRFQDSVQTGWSRALMGMRFTLFAHSLPITRPPKTANPFATG